MVQKTKVMAGAHISASMGVFGLMTLLEAMKGLGETITLDPTSTTDNSPRIIVCDALALIRTFYPPTGFDWLRSGQWMQGLAQLLGSHGPLLRPGSEGQH